jgi:hypothetical protein
MNMALMCSLTSLFTIMHEQTAKFAVSKPEEALKHDSCWEKLYSLTNLNEKVYIITNWVEKLHVITNLKRSTNFSHRSHWCGQEVS